MKNLWLTLTTIVFVASFILLSIAQETKKATQKPPISSGEAAKDKPKGEVDLALAELKKRGEGVVTMVGSGERRGARDRVAVLRGEEWPTIPR
jgi:hypothetical protein